MICALHGQRVDRKFKACILASSQEVRTNISNTKPARFRRAGFSIASRSPIGNYHGMKALKVLLYLVIGIYAVAIFLPPEDEQAGATRCLGDKGSILYNLTTPVGDDCPESSESAQTSAPVEAEPADPRMVVRGLCRRIILETLHDPRSADWDDGRLWRFTDDGDGRYTIHPTLRASNAMGATIRTGFRCEVQRNGPDDWSLVALNEI